MFDVGWDEMALIAVVALVVIGPKDLPVVMRQAGRWVRKAREMAGEFHRGLDDMMRESELAELKGQVERATDPNALRREIEKTMDPTGDIVRSLEPPAEPLAPMSTPNPMSEPEPATPTAIPVESPQKPPEP